MVFYLFFLRGVGMEEVMVYDLRIINSYLINLFFWNVKLNRYSILYI